MSIFTVRLGFACIVAALCLGGRPGHAQSAPVAYWMPGWLGFGGNLNAGQGANTDGSYAGLGSSDVGGFAVTRTNFSNGWFVGGERANLGFGMSGINQPDAFGSLYSEGVQFGYTFKNAPVTFYGGFDTLKVDSGVGSSFSSSGFTSGTAGYSAHAGVAFKPTSNLSLSLGVGFTQQSGRVDSDNTAPSLSNASQFDLVGVRR
jgi:hypothetical protein